jgi:hypothetical protein
MGNSTSELTSKSESEIYNIQNNKQGDFITIVEKIKRRRCAQN